MRNLRAWWDVGSQFALVHVAAWLTCRYDSTLFLSPSHYSLTSAHIPGLCILVTRVTSRDLRLTTNTPSDIGSYRLPCTVYFETFRPGVLHESSGTQSRRVGTRQYDGLGSSRKCVTHDGLRGCDRYTIVETIEMRSCKTLRSSHTGFET